MARRPVVLVVDDEPDIRRLVSDALRLEGYRVRTAGDGQEALQRVAEERPDLILLDLAMPAMDGTQFCHLLARAPASTAHGGRIPVILLSADRRLHEQAEELGAADYLTKPFDLDDLLAAVQRHLGAGV
jgi:CheY-like chemotaxis protein